MNSGARFSNEFSDIDVRGANTTEYPVVLFAGSGRTLGLVFFDGHDAWCLIARVGAAQTGPLACSPSTMEFVAHMPLNMVSFDGPIAHTSSKGSPLVLVTIVDNELQIFNPAAPKP